MAETRGITIKFRGDDTDFNAAVKKINGEIRQTKSEISLLNKQLKFDPKNVQALTDKFNLLKKREKELTEQTQVLKDGLNQIDPNSKEWNTYNRQLQNATYELENLKKELSSLPTAQLQIASQNFTEWGQKLDDVGKKIESVGKKLSILSAGIIGLGTSGIKFNAQLEQYQTAYTTLIGDAEKANRTIQQIQESASKTPFSTDSLIEANQYLISAGVEAEEAQKMILALGDAISATGGGSNELSRMAQNLQQIKNLGKASSVDIKQFANAGINIYGLLAETTGKSVDQLKEMDITYDQLVETFTKASSEGGKYFGAMENQSQTLTGSISALKDQISQLLGELTAELMPVIKNVLKYIRDFIARLKEMSPEQKAMITRAAEIIAILGPAITIFGKIVTTLGGISKGIGMIMKNKGVVSFIAKIAANGGHLSGVLKTIFDIVKSMINPFTVILGILAYLYTTNEQIRTQINDLVATLLGLFKPAIDLVWQVLQLLWEIMGDVVDVIMVMWEDFAKSEYAQKFISILQDIISWIQTVLGWLGQLISMISSAVGWFRNLLGAAREASSISISGRGSMTGRSMNVLNSGGYGGGSIVMNPVFNVSTSAVTREDVKSWAKWIADDVNEELGRRIR